MLKTLWIPSWYPTRVEPYSGDFIERHAKAVAMFSSLQVIFVVKDETLSFGAIEMEERQYGTDSGAWIYYYGPGKNGKWLTALLSFFFKVTLFSKGYKRFYAMYSKPSLLHLHVTVRHSWIAWWLSVKKKIPLIISEHWVGFLDEAKEEWNELSFFQRWCMQKVLKKALLLTTVSEYLANAINSKYKHIPSVVVIPNVVDATIFKPDESNAATNVAQFIHISTLSGQKNFGEIIEACVMVKKKGYNFRLAVYAPANNWYKKQIAENGLGDIIIFKKETTQVQLAKEMAISKALILYSLFETFGCVLIETNACGVPCIVSDLEIFKENTVENITAAIVPLHRPDMLCNKMISFINGAERSFEKEKIAAFSKTNFSFEKVGYLFFEEYKKLLGVNINS